MSPRSIERAYRLLLYLYPPRFRRSHGPEMRQFVRAAATTGPASTVIPMVARDTLASVPREWLDAVRARRAARRRSTERPPREPMRNLLRDVRYAARLLTKSPGFTLAAVLTLALGIGANSAIFSLADATLLRPVRVRAPEQLVVWSWTSAYPDYVEYTKRTDVFDGVAAVGSAGRLNLIVDGTPGLVPAAFVSGSTFDVLDVGVTHGRTLLPSDDVANGPVVGVLSHGYWVSRFGGDPSVVGRTFRVNGSPITIVGVLTSGFRGISVASNPGLYLPTAAFPKFQTGFFARVNALTERGFVWLTVIGRLRPGVTAEQAALAMTALYGQLHPPKPGERTERLKLEALPTRALGRGAADVRRFVGLLLGAVGITLLIACANLANLLTAKAAARRREMGVRLALGASRARVVRQVLAESILLSLAGGTAGLAVAVVALRGFGTMQLPGGIPIATMGLQINATVVVATFCLALVTGLLFGAIPALRASRTDVLASLRSDTRTATAGGGLRSALLAAQVALSLVLLTGTGLLARSLYAALQTDLGFDAGRVISASAATGLARYEDARAAAFYADAIARVRTLPQVEAAAWTSMMPTRTSWVNQIDIDGYVPERGDGVTVAMAYVGPDFFRTMGIRVERGREFGSGDTAASPRVAIVNQAMADKYWNGRSAIGGRIRFFEQWVTVVGVTANTVDRELREPAPPYAFLAFDQWLAGRGSIATEPAHLFVRARADAEAVIPLVREQVRAIDPELPVYDIAPFGERIAALVMPQRMGVTLLGSFSVLALALAAIGIYGVSSYVVALRTREIGIRMALGSDRRAVTTLMIRQSARPIAVGLLAGAALALWTGPVAAAFLYDVSPRDPLTLAAGAALLVFLALVAAYVPARRASRVDPMHALRVE